MLCLLNEYGVRYFRVKDLSPMTYCMFLCSLTILRIVYRLSSFLVSDDPWSCSYCNQTVLPVLALFSFENTAPPSSLCWNQHHCILSFNYNIETIKPAHDPPCLIWTEKWQCLPFQWFRKLQPLGSSQSKSFQSCNSFLKTAGNSPSQLSPVKNLPVVNIHL